MRELSGPSTGAVECKGMSDVQDLMARVRLAHGGEAWNRCSTLVCEGRIAAGGLSGPYLQSVDLVQRTVLTSYQLGPASMARGFDGRFAWTRSGSGEVTLQDSDAGLRAGLTDAYLAARGHLFPERWPAQLQALDSQQEQGIDYLRVEATPAGGQPVTLWFDARSLLLDRSVQQIAGKTSVKRFSDYRQQQGLWLPYRMVSGTGTDDARFDIVTELSSVQLDQPLAAGLFAAPSQTFDDLSFTDGSWQASVTVQMANNHLYLAATVDGHALSFLLDTGGVNLITAEAAARIGLACEGALEARGPGQASVSAGFVRVQQLRIGTVLLQRQLMRVLPMPGFDEVEGRAVDGVLGYELFKRLVVQIEARQRRLVFTHPRHAEPLVDAQTLPLRFYAHFPAVQARLDGVAGQFWLDTGNRNALTLWRPFVEANPVLARHASPSETTIGWGVGGRAAGRLARAGSLQLGDLAIAGPVLTLASSEEGPAAMRDVAGLIGSDLLRRFIVCFDYSRQQVQLRPDAGADDVFHHDRAGLWINRHHAGFVVMAVMASGPADEAGLQVGDVIVDVDAQPATAMDLSGFRQCLCESAEGTVFRLRIQRETQAGKLLLPLRLRSLIPDEAAPASAPPGLAP